MSDRKKEPPTQKDVATEVDAMYVRGQVYAQGQYLGIRETMAPGNWVLMFLHPTNREVPYSPYALREVAPVNADEQLFLQVLNANSVWEKHYG